MAAVERLIEDRTPPEPAAATPDAIPPAARRRTAAPRQMLIAVFSGSLVLALLASTDLPSWCEDLGDGPLTEPLRYAANAWNAGMETLGLTAPHQALRAAMQRLRDSRWR